MTADEIQQCKAMRSLGFTYTQIARAVGKAQSTVSSAVWRRKRAVQLREQTTPPPDITIGEWW